MRHRRTSEAMTLRCTGTAGGDKKLLSPSYMEQGASGRPDAFAQRQGLIHDREIPCRQFPRRLRASEGMDLGKGQWRCLRQYQPPHCRPDA
nr:hypothetical protein SHINE37_30149 [Rhizobiaceae bacterium]